ncbi:integrase [Streptomyces sp. L-9-10]|nr:integrase [Streptomyces sp. L-9-10]
MANIQKRPNGKWRARYRDLDGKETATRPPTRSTTSGGSPKCGR